MTLFSVNNKSWQVDATTPGFPRSLCEYTYMRRDYTNICFISEIRLRQTLIIRTRIRLDAFREISAAILTPDRGI